MKIVKLRRVKVLCMLMLLSAGFTLRAAAKSFEIQELEFKNSQVSDIIRVLSEDASVNIVATPEAGKKNVTIFLKKVSLEDAIRTICRISDLWYRQDNGDAGTFRLMTKEEYSKDLVMGQDDDVRVFQLRNPNVMAVAMAIESLYGNRVRVSYGNAMMLSGMGGMNGRGGNGRSGGFGNNRGMGNTGFGGGMGSFGGGMGGGFGGGFQGGFGGGSSGNMYGGRNNRFSGGMGNQGAAGGRYGNLQQGFREEVPKDLSVEQLAELGADGKRVDPGELSEVSGINKVIYVTINAEHNQLIVKTSDNAILKSISSLVDQLDKPQNQVMLEMKIIDVKVGEDFSSLFNFEIKNTKIQGDSLNPLIMGGAAAMTGGGSFVYEFLSDKIKANIEFLEKNNRVNVVSNPMLVASNHRPANLFVGEERIMVRGYSIDNIDNLNTTRTITTPETELEEIGTTLEVTPHINADGTIHIQLRQENSTLNEGAASIPVTNNTSGEVVDLPVDTITTARMEGEIFARHGYTVAVGGLIRDSFSRNRRKVPYLADIPVLGQVFRQTTDADSKSEMVLLITPYVLNQGNDSHQEYDPTDKYHRYAPDIAMQAKPVPKPENPDEPVCGEFCAPPRLRESDQ
ncbi:type II secretion system protein GspD [Methylomonas fluvii]|uniref:Type II secretion system protein GspD n=1 Tax=Methylomonas fluvii TaxID=1854564 RepID=A0ABR9DIB6_9GAMM|nr:type II secretion system protein GspD [Methylomonas fluvii]MBD9362795.1 type II secretion system protein GspD [Methylomonas fluvii]